jgi:hypothetical protein
VGPGSNGIRCALPDSPPARGSTDSACVTKTSSEFLKDSASLPLSGSHRHRLPRTRQQGKYCPGHEAAPHGRQDMFTHCESPCGLILRSMTDYCAGL